MVGQPGNKHATYYTFVGWVRIGETGGRAHKALCHTSSPWRLRDCSASRRVRKKGVPLRWPLRHGLGTKEWAPFG